MCSKVTVANLSDKMTDSMSKEYKEHMGSSKADNVRTDTNQFLRTKILLGTMPSEKADLLDNLSLEYNDDEWMSNVTKKIIPSL